MIKNKSSGGEVYLLGFRSIGQLHVALELCFKLLRAQVIYETRLIICKLSTCNNRGAPSEFSLQIPNDSQRVTKSEDKCKIKK